MFPFSSRIKFWVRSPITHPYWGNLMFVLLFYQENTNAFWSLSMLFELFATRFETMPFLDVFFRVCARLSGSMFKVLFSTYVQYSLNVQKKFNALSMRFQCSLEVLWQCQDRLNVLIMYSSSVLEICPKSVQGMFKVFPTYS